MGHALIYVANCSCIEQKSKYPQPYQFSFDGMKEDPRNRDLFDSNEIKTSKYTWYTFLPKALLLQFNRLANVYFLLISILLTIPAISPINKFTAWGPLIIVVGISLIREGYQDYQRQQSDYKNNHEETTTVIRNGEVSVVEWSEVLVGDICRVENEELFPADLILLCSTNLSGVAHIETASLDGEKNLKPRNAFPQTASLHSESQLCSLKGTFSGDLPNKNLHQFSGQLKLASGQHLVLSGDKQLLYRGARLKNTREVYGLVIYTGKNTKIIQNMQSQSDKMSQIQLKVNHVLGFILLFQIFLSLVCAIGYAITRSSIFDSDTYVGWPSYGVGLDVFLIFLTYFVLLNTMIPISLIVTMEMVKLFQKYFIEKDQLMFSNYRRKYVSVRSASLNEELGQVQYLFTDKTGTLTMNIMEFKIAVIGQQFFGETNLINGEDEGKRLHKGFHDDTLRKLLQTGADDRQLYRPITLADREGQDHISFSSMRQLAEEYFILLGLAHEVAPETDKFGCKIYMGPSPDEVALVDAAREMEYEFMWSSQSEIVLKIRGRERSFELLEVFPFTSERKRMSILIRDPRDQRIKLLTKGADSIIKQRLSAHQRLNLDLQLEKCSKIGLRTLLVGMRLVSEAQYSDYQRQLKVIPQGERQKGSVALIDRLQRDIYLLGATAVLDRLQEGVPETIRDLLRANIKVWMLTGDKMDTAENIAKSCRLIQPHFHTLRLWLEDLPNPDNSRLLPEPKNRHIEQMVLGKLKALLAQASQVDNQMNALLVEGKDLGHILNYEQCQRVLVEVSEKCRAVVCCRLLPIQKAKVVQLVRDHLDKITLAIGDGANDVPMIKTAHIGIGLFGEEDMSAVQSSDYALPEFRMLWRLVLVHGRWNYMRISEMILYFFYKNMLFTLPQFVAAFFNGFSGQTIFDDIYITLYNLAFTSIPLLFRAVLEQDVNYVYQKERELQDHEPPLTCKTLIREEGYLPSQYGINKYFSRLFPKIYFIGQENCIFNYRNFFMWVAEGALEAVLLSLFCFYVLGQASLDASGLSSDYWLVGLTIYSSVILVVTFKLATHTRFWSGCLVFSIVILSLALYVAYMWISNETLSSYMLLGVNETAWRTAETYLMVVFCTCLILGVDGVVVFVDFRRGSIASKMREAASQDQLNNRFYYDQISLYITDGLTEQEKH